MLVPVALALSFVPNVLLEVTGFIPEATTVGVIAPSIMRLVVAGVSVPLFPRIAPVR